MWIGRNLYESSRKELIHSLMIVCFLPWSITLIDEQLLEMFPGNVPNKASRVDVGQLPTSTMTEAELKSMTDRGENRECSVCLEPFATGEEGKMIVRGGLWSPW